MLLSAKTGRVREATPLRRLSHKFEEMQNRVIIHRLQLYSKTNKCGRKKGAIFNGTHFKFRASKKILRG